MHIWLVKAGEAIPTDETKDRLRRMGILAEKLVLDGHKVTWFNTTFYHSRKRQRAESDTRIKISENYHIQLIRSNSYRRNVSLSRIKNHIDTAKRFMVLAEETEKPDIILCSMPTIELAEAAVSYAKNNNIPVVVDIRDLWPDIFTEMVPAYLRLFLRPYIYFSRKRLSRLLGNADGITALTENFLQWGLRYAGRKKSPCDKVFSMAYKSERELDAKSEGSEIDQPEEEWIPFGIGKDDFLVIFFGTIGKQFVFDPVIEAAHELSNNSKIKFIICGDGEGLSTLKEKSESLNNIIYPGWVNQDKIKSLQRISSIGLAPYRESKNFTMNIPNKFAEYLSAGLPVMLGIKGEMADLVSRYNCGYLYSDGKHLARLIKDMQEDSEMLKDMSSNSKILFKKHFDADQVYPEMVKYLELVSRREI